MSQYDISQISPNRAYPASFCCRVIPSSSRDGSIHISTWMRWRQEGRFPAFKIGACWFMLGADLLRFIHAEQSPQPVQYAAAPQSAGEASEALVETRRQLGELTQKKTRRK